MATTRNEHPLNKVKEEVSRVIKVHKQLRLTNNSNNNGIATLAIVSF